MQLDPIYVPFNVSEQEVLRIRADIAKSGLTAADISAEIKKVPVEVGLMTEQGYPHAGTMDYVAPEVDSSTGTLMARGVFQNPKRDPAARLLRARARAGEGAGGAVPAGA